MKKPFPASRAEIHRTHTHRCVCTVYAHAAVDRDDDVSTSRGSVPCQICCGVKQCVVSCAILEHTLKVERNATIMSQNGRYAWFQQNVYPCVINILFCMFYDIL